MLRNRFLILVLAAPTLASCAALDPTLRGAGFVPLGSGSPLFGDTPNYLPYSPLAKGRPFETGFKLPGGDLRPLAYSQGQARHTVYPDPYRRPGGTYKPPGPTRAPEVGAEGAAAAFAVVIGSILVMTGRRRRKA
ncbi:hypothetical protein HDIA_1166 [Hartmannibacter diazotrophicus]|uniref:Uncharacterized protein n=1 Tax=Hartmannibacter diazotrophicus TaxID=1482074 RepID=A0A2C9D300_9HYPH|nr:hypothetical protein [Hartmannibacter diazotrophicus]SON54707.1 hypothetical protein HDIA_1166 [Hartmannibacter diazotrophicus]